MPTHSSCITADTSWWDRATLRGEKCTLSLAELGVALKCRKKVHPFINISLWQALCWAVQGSMWTESLEFRPGSDYFVNVFPVMLMCSPDERHFHSIRSRSHALACHLPARAFWDCWIEEKHWESRVCSVGTCSRSRRTFLFTHLGNVCGAWAKWTFSKPRRQQWTIQVETQAHLNNSSCNIASFFTRTTQVQTHLIPTCINSYDAL